MKRKKRCGELIEIVITHFEFMVEKVTFKSINNVKPNCIFPILFSAYTDPI